MTEDEKIRIKQLRNSGAGYKRIAAEMDLSVNTIKAFCKRTEESIDDGDPKLYTRVDGVETPISLKDSIGSVKANDKVYVHVDAEGKVTVDTTAPTP